MNFAKLGLATAAFFFAGLVAATASSVDRVKLDTSIYLQNAAGNWIQYVPAKQPDTPAANSIPRSQDYLQAHEQPNASDTQANCPRY